MNDIGRKLYVDPEQRRRFVEQIATRLIDDRDATPDEVLTEGVVRSWVVLGALGVLLTAIAIVVADRLGRSIVRPVLGLSEATVRLGDGDLSVRVLPDGPEEINEAGAQFNRLAERITSLLQSPPGTTRTSPSSTPYVPTSTSRNADDRTMSLVARV